MAEPVIRTPDFPVFDTYPGRAVSADRTLPEGRGEPDIIPGSDRLNGAAEQIGEAVGTAVSKLREIPAQLRSRFVLIKGRRGQYAEQASEKAEELRDAAGEQVERARLRIEHLAREYPLQLIAGTAGVAFLVGFVLRLWRSNRA